MVADVDELAPADAGVDLQLDSAAISESYDVETDAIAPVEGLDFEDTYEDVTESVEGLDIEATSFDGALDVPEIEPVEELPDLEVLGVDLDHHRAVGGKLDSLRGRKLTYVDASSLVFIETRGIRTVWGTDHHLALEGARVVPGSTAV